MRLTFFLLLVSALLACKQTKPIETPIAAVVETTTATATSALTTQSSIAPSRNAAESLYDDEAIRHRLAFKDQPDLLEDERKVVVRSAIQKRNQAYRLYKENEPEQAIAQYKHALMIHPDGDAYYYLGHSLAETNQCAEAIQAYQAAVSADFKNPELALYEKAVCFARLGKAKQAINSLKKAIDKGFSSFGYMRNDSDFYRINDSSLWKTFIRQYEKRRDIEVSEETITGALYVRDREPYIDAILCNDQFIIQYTSPPDGSCCTAYQKGSWRIDTGNLMVTFTHKCDSKGEGKPIMERLNCSVYERCSKISCHPIETPTEQLIHDETFLEGAIRGNNVDTSWRSLEDFDHDIKDFYKTPCQEAKESA